MIGRRSAVGLLLLCALLFSAFAVQSASAAPGKNTTAVTCVKTGDKKSGFEDAHCDKVSASKTGDFEHQALSAGIGKTTENEMSNEKTANNTTETTPIILKAEPFGVKVEVLCKSGKGTGTVGNFEPEAAVHKVTGVVTAEFSNCEVKLAKNCTKVKEPIVVKAHYEGVEGLGAGKNEMGVEFKPEAGFPFAEITIEGTCACGGKPFGVEGSVVATGGTATQTEKHAGVTSIFTNAMTKETLIAAGKKAEISAAATIKMKGGGEPIAFTTNT